MSDSQLVMTGRRKGFEVGWVGAGRFWSRQVEGTPPEAMRLNAQ